MYLIASGEAEVEIGREKTVLLKEGDFFGEMALIERRRHKHDVVAKTKCRIYVLDSQALSRLSRSHPEILRRIREVAHERAAARDSAEAGERKGKARAASAARRKQGAGETL
jgi:CRP-like cAMP-binding protein